ncbi:MAG: multidrug effflux MFS transporter [Halieaceae bacterium]|jgi:DHA1 family bicyclomycin/chloramphenicol resistance-like MFS transporter|nr:multidrug effflux MFS transporter [Halieaceae bacterium]
MSQPLPTSPVEGAPALENPPGSLLLILAAMVSLGPLAIDMYLPAMPGLVDALSTSTREVQLTISSFLLGFSLFHLFCGPLADRYGRRPVILGGLTVFVLASVACATATSIEALIGYRFLQGIGACVGPTLGRTVARDRYGPTGAARALSYIAMIMALAPAVAPTLGGLMLTVLPWPSVFLALAVYAGVVTVVVALRLTESLPERQALHPLHVLGNYRLLLRDSRYRRTAAASALLYAGMVAFLSGSSFVFIEMMGVPLEYFGALFITTVAGYVSGSAASARLTRKYSSETIMLLGARLAVVAATAMVASPMLWFHPASIVLPMALFAMALGLVLPHAMATALREFPQMAGTASALFGFIQMGLSAFTGVLVGTWLHSTPLPMTLTILGCALVSWWLIERLDRTDMS